MSSTRRKSGEKKVQEEVEEQEPDLYQEDGENNVYEYGEEEEEEEEEEKDNSEEEEDQEQEEQEEDQDNTTTEDVKELEKEVENLEEKSPSLLSDNELISKINLYYQQLSPQGKTHLYEILKDQEESNSRLRGLTLKQLQERIEFYEQEIQRLLNKNEDLSFEEQKNHILLDNNKKISSCSPSSPSNYEGGDGYEKRMNNSQKALFLFWKQMIRKYKPRDSKEGMNRLYTISRLLQKIFQPDYIQYPLANSLKQVEPSFSYVYQTLVSSLTSEEIYLLHHMVHKYFQLALKLRQYYHLKPQHRSSIETMMNTPTKMNYALKEIGEKDFIVIARNIKPLSLEEKAQLSHIFKCLMKD